MDHAGLCKESLRLGHTDFHAEGPLKEEMVQPLAERLEKKNTRAGRAEATEEMSTRLAFGFFTLGQQHWLLEYGKIPLLVGKQHLPRTSHRLSRLLWGPANEGFMPGPTVALQGSTLTVATLTSQGLSVPLAKYVCYPPDERALTQWL